MITVRPTLAGDTAVLAPELRKEDVQEVWASSRRTPSEALTRAVAQSKSWTVLVSGRVVAIFGVGPASNGGGVPWMLRRDRVGLSPREIQMVAKAALGWLLEEYPHLTNATNNKKSERWLQSLGFTLGDPFLIDHKDGEAPVSFRPFSISKEPPCAT